MKLATGQRALVTGASRGLGREIARCLALQGIDVALTARSAGDLQSVAQTLREQTGRYFAVFACDLSDVSACGDLATWTEREFGPLDILVNNAGIERAAAYRDRSQAEIERDIALNLTAPMLLAHALLPAMIERGGGHILNIASLSGVIATPYQEPYSATKFGLVGFSRSLRLTALMENWNIGVSALCPGFIEGDGMFARIARTIDLPAAEMEAASLAAVGKAAIDAIEQNLELAFVEMPDMSQAISASYLSAADFSLQMQQSPASRLFQHIARQTSA